MPRPRFVALLAAAALAAPIAALAQDAPAPATTAPRTEGDYAGVAPGEPAGKGAQPRGKPGTLTWVGFVAGESGGRIFLQSPGEFGFSQRVEGSTVILHLEGIKRLARNVRRPLVTRWFDTAVARVSVKKVSARRAKKDRPARKAGYEVHIEMKDAAAARELAARTSTEPDGFFYLYLDAPAGAPPAEPAPEPEVVEPEPAAE